MNSDLFFYNQAEMLLEKCENLLAVRNVIKFSKFDIPGSGYAWCAKNQNVNVAHSKVRYFSYPTRAIQVQV